MRPFAASVSGALLTLACALALPVHAATPAKKEGAFGKGGGPFLTKEQLRDCMSRQTVLAQQDADLRTEQAALERMKSDLAVSGVEMKTRLEALDRTSADAVAAYNEASQARDQQVDAYQARVDEFNSKVESRNAERTKFSASCENRRYFEEDETAIKKGK